MRRLLQDRKRASLPNRALPNGLKTQPEPSSRSARDTSLTNPLVPYSHASAAICGFNSPGISGFSTPNLLNDFFIVRLTHPESILYGLEVLLKRSPGNRHDALKCPKIDAISASHPPPPTAPHLSRVPCDVYFSFTPFPAAAIRRSNQ
jgi:hypothetical protein